MNIRKRSQSQTPQAKPTEEATALISEVKKSAAQRIGNLLIAGLVGVIAGIGALAWSSGGYHLGLKPSSHDLSGCWRASIDRYVGTLELKQQGINLWGRFKIGVPGSGDQATGTVDGHRDSKQVNLDLLWAPYTERWKLVGEITSDLQSIEVGGQASQYTIDGTPVSPPPNISPAFSLTAIRSFLPQPCDF